MFNPFNIFRRKPQTEYVTYQFCPRCGANLTLQKGFDPTAYSWICKGCGEMLINSEADNESDIVWICDSCEAVLNIQPGFNEDNTEWECTECGYVNSISEEDLYLSEEEYQEALLNPTRGMSDADILELSMYEEMGAISDHDNIILVRDMDDGKFYIKKLLRLMDSSIYRYMLEHPVAGMPRIKGVYEGNRYLVIIEEKIEGRTIDDIIETEGAIESSRAIAIATRICQIATSLHNAPTPIIHRDIKASNIILGENDEIYLLDMDAAKWFDSATNEDTVLMGTQYYAAPEQYGFTEASSSAKTDIYAQGILLNRMITGHFPKEEKAPEPFWTIIEKAIKLQPELRYTDQELSEALEMLKEK